MENKKETLEHITLACRTAAWILLGHFTQRGTLLSRKDCVMAVYALIDIDITEVEQM